MGNTEAKTQEQMGQEAPKTEERTFTQAELNAIVQERVRETTAKYENYEELKAKAQKYDTIEEEAKSELQKATERADALQTELDGMKRADAIRKIRADVSETTGVPASLLTGETKENCEAQAEAIMGFVNANRAAYPNVKDGGEVKAPLVSKEEILAIKDEKKRLEAIKENIELFD